jgi:Icc-related predicted phosphoesterase
MTRFASVLFLLLLCTACGGNGSNAGGSPPADFETGVWMGPALGVMTPTSVMMRFDTILPVACSVQYGVPADQDEFEVVSPAGTEHEVTLSGLAADTEYVYRLVIGGVVSERAHRFTTAPDDPEAPVRIAILGDVGCGCDVEIQTAEVINSFNPDLVLFTGDLAYPEASPANFRARFMIPFAKVMDHIPVYAAIGNHDADANDAAAVFSALALPRNSVDGSEQYYTHSFGCVSFTAINAEWGIESAGAPQVQWLDSVLATDTHNWKLVFDHRPMYSSGAHADNEQLKAHVRPILEARGVDFFLSGHDHNYQRTYPMVNGVPDTAERSDMTDPTGPIYVVTGGGGASLYEVAEGLPNAFVIARHHLVVIDFTPTTAWGRAASPELHINFEEFTVTKSP